MKKMLLALAVSLLLLPSSSYAKPMDVRVVLDLLDAGVSEISIQRYVQRNHFTFDLAAEDLKALKNRLPSDISDIISYDPHGSAHPHHKGRKWPVQQPDAQHPAGRFLKRSDRLQFGPLRPEAIARTAKLFGVAARARGIAPNYIARLLAAFPGGRDDMVGAGPLYGRSDRSIPGIR